MYCFFYITDKCFYVTGIRFNNTPMSKYKTFVPSGAIVYTTMVLRVIKKCQYKKKTCDTRYIIVSISAVSMETDTILKTLTYKKGNFVES